MIDSRLTVGFLLRMPTPRPKLSNVTSCYTQSTSATAKRHNCVTHHLGQPLPCITSRHTPSTSATAMRHNVRYSLTNSRFRFSSRDSNLRATSALKPPSVAVGSSLAKVSIKYAMYDVAKRSVFIWTEFVSDVSN